MTEDREINEALEDAVKARDADTARALLGQGADANYLGVGGAPLLLTAAANSDLEMVKLLIEYCADPNARSGNGDNLILTFALIQNQTAKNRHIAAEIASVLIEYGAALEPENRNSTLPIVQALARSAAEGVQVLVDNDADLFKEWNGASGYSVALELNEKYPGHAAARIVLDKVEALSAPVPPRAKAPSGRRFSL